MGQFTVVWILVGAVGLTFMPAVQATALPCVVPVMEDLTVQPNFDIDRFMGEWYQINALAEQRDPVTGDILIWDDDKFTFWFEYTLETGKRYINISLEGRDPESGNCRLRGQTSYLSLTNEAGKLQAYRTRPRIIVKDFWILLTDYLDYALIYACSQFDAQGRCLPADTYVHVFGRDISISKPHRQVVDSIVASLCLNKTNYFTTPFDQRCHGNMGRSDHTVPLFFILVLAIISFTTK